MTDLSETPFRVYRLDDGGGISLKPSFLGAADDVSLGDLLVSLHASGRLAGRVGIMYRPIEGEPGEWLASPWA